MGKDLNGKELGSGISQRKDGRYFARVQFDDIKKSAYFHNLKDAKKWVVDQKYALQNGIATVENMTFAAWFTYWLDDVKGNTIAYRTQESYRELYKRYVKSYLGKMMLDKIKPIHCLHVLKTMEKQGLADSTIKKTRTVMHECFESALENRLVIANPISKSVTAKGQPVKERFVMTRAQQQAFIEEAKAFSHSLEYEFVLLTGLRYGELAGLKWKDVDWKQKTITINRALYFQRDIKRFVEKEPKSKAGYRTIPLTDGAIEILKKQWAKNTPIVLGYQNYVFRNDEGKPSQKSAYNKPLKVIMKNLGLPPISMHNLRHTFATRCIEAGMRPKTLQKILGHSSLAMTMDLYVHVTNDELISEFDKIKDDLVV